jgi:hypothetical protein
MELSEGVDFPPKELYWEYIRLDINLVIAHLFL